MGLILIKTCAFVALFSAVCAVQSVFLDEIKDTKQCKYVADCACKLLLWTASISQISKSVMSNRNCLL